MRSSLLGRRSGERTAPVTVEIIAYAPTAFYHCQHCELTFQELGLAERLRREEARSALPDDLAQEFQELSDWVRQLGQRHGGRVHFKVVDAASVEGVLLSLRHRVFRYPAVIVDGRDKQAGADLHAADPIIERHVTMASAS